MRKSGSTTEMEGNELSYSEYLKCNNPCVKVTINRYRGLGSGTLLRQLHDDRHWAILTKLEPSPVVIGIYITLDQCNGLPSFKALFTPIVDSTKGIDQFPFSAERFPSFTLVGEVPRKLFELCDPRHPSLPFFRVFMLRNFIIPEVIKTMKFLSTHGLELPNHLQRLLQCIEQDFEREEIDHGSGFLIADDFVITNKHVIEEAMSDETLEVRIQNETIRDMPCVVAHWDAGSDLALLYCHGLNSKEHGICPLDLSEEALWPSLSVFSFGFPFTHTGRSALFVEGKVSGFQEPYGREPFVVLNCALNPGNSGSPVFRRIGDDIKVVGVVAQKHKKDILTLEEISILEEERSTLNSASDSRDHFRKSLLLKMYDALNETHCQFGFGNMVPGHLVVKFLSDPSVTSIMDFVEEMELKMSLMTKDELKLKGKFFIVTRIQCLRLNIEKNICWLSEH